jgi:peptidoglycan/LPS O-acetylase OafA/YrhL
MTKAAHTRFYELDGLRGIAALWVMIFHYTFGIKFFWLRDAPDQVLKVTPWTYNIEALRAVDLFFMISGFVIFMTIGQCNTVRDFLVSRFARLYPAFWAAVSVTAFAAILMPLPLQPVSPSQILINYTMLQTYFAVPPIEDVYWSLAFEFGFYFLIVIAFVSGFIRRIELIGLLWIAIAFVAFRLYPAIGAAIPYRLQALTALPYANLFFSGILFYRIRSAGPTPSACALLVLCYAVGIYGQGPVFIGITTANFLIFTLCVMGRGQLFASKFLVFLGVISYSLYLVHNSIGYRVMMVSASFGLPPWANLILAVAVTIGLASAITFLIERPANRYIRRAYRQFTLKPAPGE